MAEPANTLVKRNGLERFLLLFADVRAGEGLTAILLTVNLFLLLTAYLIIKIVREALILSEGGAEIKSYAAAGQALLLFLLVPAYGYLASKVNRVKLINAVTLFFISNLAAFYVLSRLGVSLGVSFFLWVGIFNLFIIAQFWSFANDIYSEDQGKRLFAIIAFGGSLGAVLGPKVASTLFEPFGPYFLMLVTAALLGVCLIFPNIVNRMESHSARAAKKASDASQPLAKGGSFKLVIGKPYLFLIAFLLIASNLVNTTGEFILGKTVTQEAQRLANAAPAATSAEERAKPSAEEQKSKKVQDFIARFYGDFFFTVSLAGGLAQLFLVSRIMKLCGVPASLYFLPIIALTGYSIISFIPALAFIRWAKVLENSTNYSLQNTARQALFLPTTREEKYKAKAAIDTFFVRIGDLLSTALVFLSVQFSFTLQTLSVVNVCFTALWLVLVVVIGASYRALAAEQVHAAAESDSAGR
ncbi:MAG TPA: Npt1/Npt2 family nucleotide transporter [Candidatus Binatia bacterium]